MLRKVCSVCRPLGCPLAGAFARPFQSLAWPVVPRSQPHVAMARFLSSVEGSSSKGFDKQLTTPFARRGGQGVKGPIRDRPHQRAAGGRVRKSVAGVININHSWNNTIVNISDINYVRKGWVSAGAAELPSPPPPSSPPPSPRSYHVERSHIVRPC